ncbi:MAG: hypothetical protein MJZ01_00540 [Bacteroidales bacterium]|nr:hypothetical protein [Bacteroidales bacterium]
MMKTLSFLFFVLMTVFVSCTRKKAVNEPSQSTVVPKAEKEVVSSISSDKNIQQLDSLAQILRKEMLHNEGVVNYRRDVKVLPQNGGSIKCRTIVSEANGQKLSIRRTIEHYQLKEDGSFIIRTSYFDDDSDSWDYGYCDTVNHSQALFEMIDRSSDEQRPGFSKDFIPIKRTDDNRYVISSVSNYIYCEPDHLYFDLPEGSVHMISYDVGNGSYIFLVIIYQGESDECLPFLYANGTFTSMPNFFGYDCPVDPLFRNKREGEWPCGDGSDFYMVKVFDPNHIRVELADMRGSKTDTIYVANYVDYEFDQSSRSMHVIGKGYLDEKE